MASKYTGLKQMANYTAKIMPPLDLQNYLPSISAHNSSIP